MTLAIYTPPKNSWDFIKEEAEKYSPLMNIPDELLEHIFSFLSLKNLALISSVCRKWDRVASEPRLWARFDLQKLFPELEIINEATWNLHLPSQELNWNQLPALNHRAVIKTLTEFKKARIVFDDTFPSEDREVLQKRLPARLTVEEDAGMTLMTVPSGLTFSKLIELTAGRVCFKVDPSLMTTASQASFRVLITNSIFEMSTRLSQVSHQLIVTQMAWELPERLSVAALATLTYLSRSTPLYSSGTFTRCSDGGAVGNFQNAELSIIPTITTSVGVGAQKKF